MNDIITPFEAFSSELNKLTAGKDGKFINQPEFKEILDNAYYENPWFTQDNIITALKHLAYLTTRGNLEKWLSAYQIKPAGKKVLTVMAGNIPLVGFHDMLSVLASGNIFIGKMSSKDRILPKFVKELLVAIDSDFSDKIILTEDTVKDFDAVIATGSDNSAKYFEKYFGAYPNIIRKSRSSVAIIAGNETEEELKALAHDIFLYFGLGCRNISKIYFPEGYDIGRFIDIMNKTPYTSMINHNKYANNYDYNKAIYLMNKIPFSDGNFFLLKEDTGIMSPVAVVYYEFYQKTDNFDIKLLPLKDKIQIVIKPDNFGKAQFPELTDYADGIDVMEFLINL